MGEDGDVTIEKRVEEGEGKEWEKRRVRRQRKRREVS